MIQAPRKVREVPVTFEYKASVALQCLPSDVRERVLEKLTFLASKDLQGRTTHEVAPGFVAIVARAQEELKVADLFCAERYKIWARLDEDVRQRQGECHHG